MPREYAGHLRADDPLHAYLSHQVLPNMGVTGRPVDFRVFCLKEMKVYRYEESHSRTQVVGKFFVNGSHHGPVAMERMRREFENLQVLRGYGLAGYPHHVVRRASEIAIMTLGLVRDNTEKPQEALMAVADIVMELFAMESSLLRSRKFAAGKGENAADMCTVLLRDALARIEVSARSVLGACLAGDALRARMTELRRLAEYDPVDAVRLRRAIAGRLLARERYVV